MDKPSYYAIIPAEVRYSDLKPSAKLLYGEITALSNKHGYCFASNNYFSNLYGVTKNTISVWISELHKKNFVTVEVQRNESKQVIKRKIGITKNNVTTPIKNREDNSTSINNTSNNNISIRELNFINQVSLLEYDVELKKEFCDYWTEKNTSKTKMKFELERTFDVNLRLKRWCKNNKSWGKKTPSGKAYYLNKKSNTEANINTWKSARNMLDNLET